MVQITRRLEFDAGHRLVGHESKCANLHGHRYRAEITVSAPELDGVGRVVDFSVVKKEVGGWIDEHWDHNMILHVDDPLAPFGSLPDCCVNLLHDILGAKKPYIMPHALNPTAENMAWVLFGIAWELFSDTPLVVEHVRLYETPNCWADYRGED